MLLLCDHQTCTFQLKLPILQQSVSRGVFACLPARPTDFLSSLEVLCPMLSLAGFCSRVSEAGMDSSTILHKGKLGPWHSSLDIDGEAFPQLTLGYRESNLAQSGVMQLRCSLSCQSSLYRTLIPVFLVTFLLAGDMWLALNPKENFASVCKRRCFYPCPCLLIFFLLSSPSFFLCLFLSVAVQPGAKILASTWTLQELEFYISTKLEPQVLFAACVDNAKDMVRGCSGFALSHRVPVVTV